MKILSSIVSYNHALLFVQIMSDDSVHDMLMSVASDHRGSVRVSK